MPKLPKEFIDLCHSVTAKRPKTVVDHILEHGSITTEELKEKYGYNHPPRAARDVREHGIPQYPTKLAVMVKVANSIQKILCFFLVLQTGQNHGLVSIARIGTTSKIEQFA